MFEEFMLTTSRFFKGLGNQGSENEVHEGSQTGFPELSTVGRAGLNVLETRVLVSRFPGIIMLLGTPWLTNQGGSWKASRKVRGNLVSRFQVCCWGSHVSIFLHCRCLIHKATLLISSIHTQKHRMHLSGPARIMLAEE